MSTHSSSLFKRSLGPSASRARWSAGALSLRIRNGYFLVHPAPPAESLLSSNSSHSNSPSTRLLLKASLLHGHDSCGSFACCYRDPVQLTMKRCHSDTSHQPPHHGA
nr:hypothetical protein CFP56_37106 [Quercus suber]